MLFLKEWSHLRYLQSSRRTNGTFMVSMSFYRKANYAETATLFCRKEAFLHQKLILSIINGLKNLYCGLFYRLHLNYYIADNHQWQKLKECVTFTLPHHIMRRIQPVDHYLNIQPKTRIHKNCTIFE
jgi:hypothetical protein